MGIRKPLPAGISIESLLGHPWASPATQSVQYSCKLVTPMYGGGVKAGEVDRSMPIRTTGIRGQLRFWWRLLNRRRTDGTSVSSTELFQRERAIWGGLGGADTLAASKIMVRVTSDTTAARLVPAARYAMKNGSCKGPIFDDLPGYALFPAQGKASRNGIETAPAQLLDAGTQWRLEIFANELPDKSWKEVLLALRWWSTFGGVGARTRRGCGAVEVRDTGGNLLRIGRDEVEAAGMSLYLRPPEAKAVVAWKVAVKLLQDFRQGSIGRNPRSGQATPGRSYWPEADAIRRAVGPHSNGHSPVHAAGQCFPRAAFGMPIIFHFKPEPPPGDPKDTTLKPSNAERMASPLVIRPYPAPDGRWIPSVLRLDRGQMPDVAIVLEGGQRALPLPIPKEQWQSGPWTASITPIADYGKDALSAFLAYFMDGVDDAVVATALAARPIAVIPPKAADEEQRFMAQITFNRANGTVGAKNLKTHKSMTAIGDAAGKVWASVSPEGKKAVASGRYVATAVVMGGKLVGIEEKK